MVEPKVLIALIVYNEESSIEASLRSLLNQTYRNISVLIFDNASTDKTVEKIKFFKDSRINIFLNSCNQGSWNNYLRMVEYIHKKENYEYFLWADVDDFYYEEYLGTLVDLMENNLYASVAVPTLKIKWVNEDGSVSKEDTIFFDILSKSASDFHKAFQMINNVSLQFCMITRGFVRRNVVALLFSKKKYFFSIEEFCALLAFYSGGIISSPKLLHEKNQSLVPLEVRLPGAGKIYDIHTFKKKIGVLWQDCLVLMRTSMIKWNHKIEILCLLIYRLFIKGKFIKIISRLIKLKKASIVLLETVPFFRMLMRKDTPHE